jgi:hypothetical protein
MEGFANYFSRAVGLTLPGRLSGTPFPLETQTPCNAAPPDAIEDNVAALLWDLVDVPTDPGSRAEPLDLTVRQDLAIFRILDRELDQGVWPTITMFHDAWRDRGLDHDGFDRIAGGLGLGGLFPQFENSRLMETQQQVVRNLDGRLEVFARGPGDGLWHMYQTSPGGPWSAWQPLGGVITARPSAIVGPDGRVHVFVRGMDNSILLKRQVFAGGPYEGGWVPLFGRLMSAPAVAVSGNLITIFARGADDGLWGNRVDLAGNPSGWFSLGGQISSAASAVTPPDGRHVVFARGINKDIVQISETRPASWQSRGEIYSAWGSLFGFLTSAPSVAMNIDGRIEVFAVGADFDSIWSTSQMSAGGGFNNWMPLDSPPGSTVTAPAVIRDAAGRLTVFTSAPDGTVFAKSQVVPGSTSYQSFQPLFGRVTYPAVGSDMNGNMWVFGQSLDTSGAHSLNQINGPANPFFTTNWTDRAGAFFRF